MYSLYATVEVQMSCYVIQILCFVFFPSSALTFVVKCQLPAGVEDGGVHQALVLWGVRCHKGLQASSQWATMKLAWRSSIPFTAIDKVEYAWLKAFLVSATTSDNPSGFQ
jgi:hypothetical protein